MKLLSLFIPPFFSSFAKETKRNYAPLSFRSFTKGTKWIGWKWIERNFVYLTHPTPKNHPPFNYGTPLRGGGEVSAAGYRQSFEETTLLHVNAPTAPMNFSYTRLPHRVGPTSSRSIIASNDSISIQSPNRKTHSS